MTAFLKQENGYIFRIVHRGNLPAVLARGLCARHSAGSNKAYITIGDPDLIGRRGHRTVPVEPGGVLNDYVPFYFTPHSPMALNVKTGWNGITQRANDDIIIFVSTLYHVLDCGLDAVFTDRHAYLATANFYRDPARLDRIDWTALRSKDFKKDPKNPERVERYQAEALVHGHVPLTGLKGVAVYSDRIRTDVQRDIDESGTSLTVRTMPGWYF